MTERPDDSAEDREVATDATGRTDESPDEREARHRRAVLGERWTAVSFGITIVSSIALGVVFWRGGQPQLEGLFLALALGGIGVALVVWATQFMPKQEIEEERKDIASTDEEVAEFQAEFERGEHILARRGLLVKMGGAAMAALLGALVFPIRSLGPRPGKGFKATPFRKGVRLVTEDNKPIRADDLVTDGVLTVFPEDHTEAADAPTLLIRPRGEVRPVPGREDWSPGGLVAYSKLCTHVGCPVGLYQSEEHLLLCPCHQSTFDVLDGARPVFGPAARPLPQLPISIDDDGHVVADGDFSGPTGAGFWDRDRD
jgi:ubiquinol-cytochrome c reductase iron-sulfur subunit